VSLPTNAGRRIYVLGASTIAYSASGSTFSARKLAQAYYTQVYYRIGRLSRKGKWRFLVGIRNNATGSEKIKKTDTPTAAAFLKMMSEQPAHPRFGISAHK
jgi:hypothetical protein